MLLECARPHPDPLRLNGLLIQPLDWAALYTVTEQHLMLPLLNMRLQEFGDNVVPPDISQKLQEYCRAHALLTLRLIAELFRVTGRLAARNIETLAIKGPILSLRCYGDPGIRHFTDLDFIVRGQDIARCTEAMLELGYEPRIPLDAIAAERIPGEYVFRHPETRVIVEFHTEHTFRYHPRRLELDKVFERKASIIVDQHCVPALSVEDELVFSCIHAAKHLWERLAWVADLAALLSHTPSLDWRRAESAAAEVRAERMFRVGLGLATGLLAVPLPPHIANYVESDATAVRLALQIADRLPQTDSITLGILRRAAFRVKMRGGFLTGLSYLLRLSLSPTEEDWLIEGQSNRPCFWDAISRPFRLTRKYRRESREKAG